MKEKTFESVYFFRLGLLAGLVFLASCSKVVPELDVVPGTDSGSSVDTTTNTTGNSGTESSGHMTGDSETGTASDTSTHTSSGGDNLLDTATSADTATPTETATDTTTHTTVGSDSGNSTDTITDTNADTNADTTGITDSNTNADTQGGTDIDTESSAVADCVSGGGFWYDADDVTKLNAYDPTTGAAPPEMAPECHDVGTTGCPAAGEEIIWAMRRDGTLYRELVTSDQVDLLYEGYGLSSFEKITHVFSTLRCLPGLRNIEASYHEVERANLTSNRQLMYVNFYANGVLNWIGLPNTDTIRELHLAVNQLRSIDLTPYPRLWQLWLAHNKLTSVDLSGLPDLQLVYINGNSIGGHLNLADSPDLEQLDASSTLFESIALPNAPENQSNLVNLSVAYNPHLVSLEMPDVDRLVYLNVEETGLRTLDLTGATFLESLLASATLISEIALADAGARLKQVFVAQCNNMERLDLHANPNIEEITAYYSQNLTEIVLAPETLALHTIDVNETPLETLDVSGAPNLRTLHVSNDVGMSGFDFSNATGVTDLEVSGNTLWDTELDLSQFSDLEYAQMENCGIAGIQFADDVQIHELNLGDNRISKIEIPGCDPSAAPGSDDSVNINLSGNRLEYAATDTDMLSFTSCETLQSLNVYGNSDLYLHIDTDAFTDAFLNGAYSRIYMDPAQWDNAIIDTSYGWTYDESCYCALKNPKK